MEEQDNQQAPKALDKPIPKMSLSKFYLWIGSLFALTAAILGTLADGKSVLSVCNSTEAPRQIEKVDVSKLKFKKYQGRYGCSFLYPADWELSIDNPARDKQIRHPTNPEISIFYSGMFYPVDFDNIRELGEEQEKWLKEGNGKVISLTYYQRYSTNCDASSVRLRIFQPR